MRCLFVVGALILIAPRVGAQVAPPVRQVDLSFAGDAIESSGLAPVIEELLERIDVEIRQGPLSVALDPRDVLTPRPDAPPAVARVWIEIAPTRTTIYLVDSEWERILIRHVPTEAGLDEVSREQVAHIVQAAVDALLAGAQIGFTRERAREELGIVPEPSAEPDPPAAPAPDGPAPDGPPDVAGDVHAGYGLGFFADGLSLRHAVMLHGSLLLGTQTARLAVSLGFDFWPTTSYLGGGLRLDLRTVTVRAEGGVDIELIEGTYLRVAGGITLDVTAVEPRSVPGSSTVVAAAWDAVAPLLSIRLMLRQQIWEWIGFVGGLILDIDLLDTHYVVQTGGTEETVIDPWLVRPLVFLGLGGRI